MTTQTTHEDFINAVRRLAVERIGDTTARAKLLATKMVYGVGAVRGTRGVTFYEAWQNGTPDDFIEICALGEESDVQLAGTTIHELGHVLAGHGAGHGPAWKAACRALGLTVTAAGGQHYTADHFDATLWAGIAALPTPTDGRPMFRAVPGGLVPVMKPRPCPLGIGTRGGKSRGTGSGSRLRLYVCNCTPDPEQGVTNKVRVASDNFDATCNRCGSAFKRAESVPANPATEAAA